MNQVKGIDQPFRVETKEGNFCGGCDTMEQAELLAKMRNERAKVMGLKVAYVALAKPA